MIRNCFAADATNTIDAVAGFTRVTDSVLKGGKLVSLKVTPASREKDIVNWLGKHPAWEPLKPRVSIGQGKPTSTSTHNN